MYPYYIRIIPDPTNINIFNKCELLMYTRGLSFMVNFATWPTSSVELHGPPLWLQYVILICSSSSLEDTFF